MSTLGIVVISLIAGAFILLLLIAAALLIYHSIESRKQFAIFLSKLEAAAQGFDTTLTKHREEMSGAIGTINGAGLLEASRAIRQGADRIVPAVIALNEVVKLLINETRMTHDTGLGPEEYGPDAPGDYSIGQSRVMKLDDAVTRAENEDVTFTP